MNKWVFMLLVVLATSLMGSSFTVGKMGLAYVSPLLLAGVRFTIAGALMALWLKRQALPGSWKVWRRVAIIGVLQTTGVMACIFLAMRTITASETSILTFLNPLLVVLWGTLFLGIRYRYSQWLGVVAGFIGVSVSLGFRLHYENGIWLGLGSAVFWSIATILVKRWGSDINVWAMSTYQMLIGGVFLLLLGITFETPIFILNFSSAWIILYLAIFGSIVQFVTWFYLLNRGDPGKTSAFLFLAPLFGVLSGWLFLGEVVNWRLYVGCVCVLAGIFLVNWTSVAVRPAIKRGEV